MGSRRSSAGFCLKSSKKLILAEALLTYCKKDSIEKIFNSLKNEIEVKSLRVWTDNSNYSALIIGFIAQLFVSLIRFEIPELKHTSTKFIKQALLNLAVTIDSWMRKTKNYMALMGPQAYRMKKGEGIFIRKYIHSYFDTINMMTLRHNRAISGSGEDEKPN